MLSFSAFVDQRKTKLSLILIAINPDIGGLLIKGKKGSGKSSLVRSFANLLPKIEYSKGCPYHCNPNDVTKMCKQCRRKLKRGEINKAKKKMEVINLPLGATEDAVVGTVNIEKTLKEKKKKFQPGILAKANRNILYIDEVNLLPDHLTDTILDAAAMGWNHVEREGISVKHPANFILIGTMNPEEGELRPQLLDRFGLCVNMNSVREVAKRKEIIEKNIQSSSKSEQRDQERDEKIKERITTAKKLLPHVETTASILKLIAITCRELGVDGHRPDIVATLAAKAFTAFDGRRIVRPKDVSIGLHFSLNHRTRKSGELAPPSHKEIGKALKIALKRLKDSIEEEKMQLEKKREMLQGEDKRKGVPVKREKPITKSGPRGMKSENVERYKDQRQQLPPGGRLLKGAEKGPPMGGTFPMGGEKGWTIDVSVKGSGRVKTTWKKTPSKGGTATKGGERDKEATSIPLGKVSMEDFQSEGNVSSFRQIKLLKELNKLKHIPPTSKRRKLPKIRGVKGYSQGRRAPVISESKQGRVSGYKRPKGSIRDIALTPTLRTAALRCKKRELAIKKRDIKVKKRQHKAKAVISLIIDASKSMERYILTIGKALIRLHQYAWRKKDKIGIVICRGKRAEVKQTPTSNSQKMLSVLGKISCGGKTPLASGLLRALRVLQLEKRKSSDIIPLSIILTDGLGNVPLQRPINHQMRKEFHYPSQADILSVARRYSNSEIPLLVINPLHMEKWHKEKVISPTLLLREIGRMTKGAYVGFQKGFFSSKDFTEEKIFRILRQKLAKIIKEQAARM